MQIEDEVTKRVAEVKSQRDKKRSELESEIERIKSEYASRMKSLEFPRDFIVRFNVNDNNHAEDVVYSAPTSENNWTYKAFCENCQSWTIEGNLEPLIERIREIDGQCWGNLSPYQKLSLKFTRSAWGRTYNHEHPTVKPERMKIYVQEPLHQVNLIVYAGVQLRDEIKTEVEDMWIRGARRIIQLQQQIDGIKPVKHGDFDHSNIDQL